MKAEDIGRYPIAPKHGEEWLSLLTAHNLWLREIAYQFATLNDTLSSDVNIHIHNHGEAQDFRKLAREIITAMKEMTDEAKQAILEALATLGTDIIAAATNTAKAETDQIITFISKLQTQNGPITKDDIGTVLDMIKGVAPKVNTGVTAAIDAISTGAGADTGTGGTPNPNPGPTP